MSHRQQQSQNRQNNENNLMNMIVSRRQSACQMQCPEDRVVPEGKPRPFFAPSKSIESDHDTEYAGSGRRDAKGPQQTLFFTGTRSLRICGNYYSKAKGRNASGKKQYPARL